MQSKTAPTTAIIGPGWTMGKAKRSAPTSANSAQRAKFPSGQDLHLAADQKSGPAWHPTGSGRPRLTPLRLAGFAFRYQHDLAPAGMRMAPTAEAPRSLSKPAVAVWKD